MELNKTNLNNYFFIAIYICNFCAAHMSTDHSSIFSFKIKMKYVLFENTDIILILFDLYLYTLKMKKVFC